MHLQPLGAGLLDRALPIITRWTLRALGSYDGPRLCTPRDPVAAWLLRAAPELEPTIPQKSLLSTIRARSELVDRMIEDEAQQARHLGRPLSLWFLGSGFDGRWLRFQVDYGDIVREHVEVECPEVMAYKERLLARSPFAVAWRRVQREPTTEDTWTVTPSSDAQQVVILEGLAGRLPDVALRLLLRRIRWEAPDARLIVGLSVLGVGIDRRWTAGRLSTLGWRVEEDLHLGTRGRMMSPSTGLETCPGMYPFRLVRLSSKEPT